MSSDDLHRLIGAAAQDVTEADKDTLTQLGVHDRSLAGQREIGVARVNWHRDRRPLFDFAEDGERSFVQRVATWGNSTFDLVAWSPTRPDRWALYKNIGWALGEPEIERAAFHNMPLPLWRRPVDFLAHDFTGAVVLDWSAAWAHLSGLTVVGEDADHAREIRKRIRPPFLDLPKIAYARKEAEAA